MDTVKEIRKNIVKDIDTFYEAAFAAICHCSNNPKGVFPTECSCQTKDVQESITLLLNLRKELLRKYAGGLEID